MDNTPFWVIGRKIHENSTEEEWFIIFHKYRVSDIQKTEQDAINTLKEKQWEVIATIAGIVSDIVVAEKLQQKQRGTQDSWKS